MGGRLCRGAATVLARDRLLLPFSYGRVVGLHGPAVSAQLGLKLLVLPVLVRHRLLPGLNLLRSGIQHLIFSEATRAATDSATIAAAITSSPRGIVLRPGFSAGSRAPRACFISTAV